MRRRLGFLLMTAMLIFAGGTVGYADHFAAAIPAALSNDGLVLAGEKADRRDGGEDLKEDRGERRLRKGFGARFWGPYWGYGPSGGRRCDRCQEECASEDGDSARCKRCRIRCGE